MKVALCTEWVALNSGQSGSLRAEYSLAEVLEGNVETIKEKMLYNMVIESYKKL